MKIKSIVMAAMISASSLYAGSSVAQVQGLPIIGGLLSGGGGIPVLGSLGGGGLPGLDGIPLLGSLDSFIPAMPSGIEGIVDIAAVPAILPGLLSDLPRSFGRNAGAVSGLPALATELSPLGVVSTGAGIGSNLGVGALYSLIPLLDVATTSPANIATYLLGGGTILTQFGALGSLPAIPLVTSPLGLGTAEGIPVLGGLGDLPGGF
tara:strand:- start:227 stop:847 length:621 start_codon:yes stop_codon:yes gene_type:complete